MVAWVVYASSEALVSGQPLGVRANGGVGLLAAPKAIKSVPVGCAKVFGHKRPDLFVSAPTGVQQALYLYRWVRDTPQGQPVFAPPLKVSHPWGDDTPPDGTILQDNSGVTHALWLKGKDLIHCRFERDTLAFRETARFAITGLPRTATSVTVLTMTSNGVDVVVACYNGAKYRPDGDVNRLDYVLYDGSGAFRGLWPRSGLYRFRLTADFASLAEPASLFSPSKDEMLGGVALATVTYPDRPAPGIIAGASLGNLYLFDGCAGQAKNKRTLFGPDRISIRHPTIGAAPIVYPNATGQLTDLIVGGEGALTYYAFSGMFNSEGHPVYKGAQPVWQEEATLYAGSLAVPSVADWDGDGAHDLLVGNSEGRVLFFRNSGSDREPLFGLGEPLTAGGQPIHVQPGYYGIQGPFETRWGYTCPAVTDWNGDGLPDLLLSSATARHEVFINAGTRSAPQLGASHPLCCDGLELHGTWRVRPGVANINGRMAYVAQDDANALHLYWRIDDVNLEDGGALIMEDGTAITSHTPEGTGGPGQRGRSKIEVSDWDGDGLLDLLIGTVKRGCIPNPQSGLPWTLRQNKEKGLQVLFLRNSGSNAAPRYQQPKLFQFRGKDLYLGAHSNAPKVCPFGDPADGPHLLVGAEDGRIYFFARKDLTFDPR